MGYTGVTRGTNLGPPLTPVAAGKDDVALSVVSGMMVSPVPRGEREYVHMPCVISDVFPDRCPRWRVPLAGVDAGPL
ncbi:MAG: hypothetical protein ACYCP0_05470 [Acidiferrobacteraceae bacterium]